MAVDPNYLRYLRGRLPNASNQSQQSFTPRLTTGPSPGIDPATGRFAQSPTSTRQYEIAREAQLGVGSLSQDEIIRRGGPQRMSGETDIQWSRRLNEWYQSQRPSLYEGLVS